MIEDKRGVGGWRLEVGGWRWCIGNTFYGMVI